MSGRFIFAIVSTLMEETIIVLVVLWGLPMVNIHIPLAGLIPLMVIWGAYNVMTYRMGSRALIRQQIFGLPNMVGCKGKIVSSLAPEGLIKVRGELWLAKSAGGDMEVGEEVIVVEQERLKLIVCPSNPASDLEKTE